MIQSAVSPGGSVAAMTWTPDGTRPRVTSSVVIEAITPTRPDTSVQCRSAVRRTGVPSGVRPSRDPYMTWYGELPAASRRLALALIGRPRLLAVDDTDLKLSDADRAEAWALLRSVAESGTTVLAVCSEAPEDALRITTLDGQDGQDRKTPETTEASETPETTEASKTDADADTDSGADTDTRTADTDADHVTEDTTEEGAADALAETGRA